MSAPPVPAALAAGCVDAWVRLAARLPLASPAEGDAGETAAAHRLLLVDGFAGAERAGVRGRLGGARASAGVAALASGVRRERMAVAVEAAAVLADEDPAQLAAVRAALASPPTPSSVPVETAGGSTPRFSADATIRVSLAEGRFAALAGDLAAAATAPARSLWMLAPPSAGALPWSALAPLLALDGADVLLAFPAPDVHRHARYADTPFADLPGHVRTAVAGVSALLGDERHAWLGTWRRAMADGGAAEAESRLAAAWAERIARHAPARVVKHLRVVPEGDAGGAVHLLLVTADSALALEMNGLVRALGLRDEAADPAPRIVPAPADAEVLELFAAEEMGAPNSADADLPIDAAALADRIASARRGATATYADILRALASTDAAPEDARRAMALLKRQGRARFRTLADDAAEIEFPADPAPPLRRAPVARPLAIAADTAAGPLFEPPTHLQAPPSRAARNEGGRPPRKENARRRRGPADQASGS